MTMSDKNCMLCVFYEHVKEGYSTGSCGYPVPEWLRIGMITPFIATPEYSGQDCATFKSKLSVAEDALKDKQI